MLSTYASDIAANAKGVSEKLATSLARIETLKATIQITEDEARLHLDLQRNAARAVFMAIKGITLIAAESAINAALSVVKGAINTQLGFALIA